MIRLFLFFLLFVCSYSKIESVTVWESHLKEGFSVKVEASFTKMSVDQKLVLEVLLNSPAGYRVDKETLLSNLLSYVGYGPVPFILFSQEEIFSDEKGQKFSFVLDAEMPGVHQLTFRGVEFESKTGSKVVVPTGVFSIKVELPPLDSTFIALPAEMLALTDKFPIDLSYKNRINFVDNPKVDQERVAQNEVLFKKRQFPWRILNFFVFVVTLFLFLRYMFIRMKAKKLEERRVETAKEKALEVLANLHLKNSEGVSDYDRFYVRLTDVVRGYLEEAFQFNAPTLTTEEFLEEISNQPILDEDTRKLLFQFLHLADRVKFAQHLPTDEECQNAVDAAKTFVQKDAPL